jgi:hypothetical protein
MRELRFGTRELYAGSRFIVPLSEEALLAAGHAAGFRAGGTLVEVGAGNGCVAVFLAEAFHLYVRGFESDPALLDLARANAERSPARRRLRFSAGEADGQGDFVAALRGPAPVVGARLLLGRFDAPLALGFPAAADPPGRVTWRRDATPLEWERYLAPLERSLRAYRALLRPGDAVAPLALAMDEQISAFRARAALVRYELQVVER